MDTKDCAYCRIDFVPVNGNQKFCRTPACIRDRDAEAQERWSKRVPKEPGYKNNYGHDPTTIGINQHLRCGKRKKQAEEL